MIKKGYYNGELVYVFGQFDFLIRERGYKLDDEWRKVQIIKHRDLIRNLNKLFKSIESADDKEFNKPLGLKQCLFQVMSVFRSDTCPAGRLPFEIMNEELLSFDDDTKCKAKKAPRLSSGSGKKAACKLTVISGRIQQHENTAKTDKSIINPKYQAWVDEWTNKEQR